MIVLPDRRRLTPATAYGLDVLVDLSRLVPMGEGALSGSDDRFAGSGGGAGEGARATDGPTPVRLEIVSGEKVPTLGELAQGKGWTVAAGRLAIQDRALELITDLAGAGAEQRTTVRDGHGRVPASENPLVAAGLERVPVVSQAAAALRRAALQAAGRGAVVIAEPWPQNRSWAAALTHDVDVVAWWPAFTALRLSELARGGHVGLMARVALAAMGGVSANPVARGVEHVLRLEHDAAIEATWFFLCGSPTVRTATAGDLTYRPESRRARWIIEGARRAGHEVGLHGSFATSDSAEALASERGRLQRISGETVSGVRQHYLRMTPGRTQGVMATAGFRYDATFGFSSRNGFRLGVADVVPAWSGVEKRALPIDEVPLVWMDRALSKYAGVEEPDRWVADAVELMEASEAVEGLWVGLWHPNLTAPLGFVGAERALEALVAKLVERRPWTATLARIVDWRAARRGVRIDEVAPDGRVAATLPPAAADRPVLRNAAHGAGPLEVQYRVR